MTPKVNDTKLYNPQVWCKKGHLSHIPVQAKNKNMQRLVSIKAKKAMNRELTCLVDMVGNNAGKTSTHNMETAVSYPITTVMLG
jgi:hypothetical protein